MKKLLMLVLGFTFIQVNSWAQRDEVKNDFLLINQHYLDAERMSMTVAFKIYSEGSNVPLETEMGFYRVSNGSVNFKYFGVEVLIDNNLVVTSDDEGKKIILDTVRTSEGVAGKSAVDLYLDSLFKYYKDVKTLDLGNGIYKYDFYFDRGSYSKVEVYVNSTTFFITKIVNYLSEKIEVTEGNFKSIRAEIEFSNINTSPLFTNEFNRNRFVQKVEGTYQLVPRYSTYTLVKML